MDVAAQKPFETRHAGRFHALANEADHFADDFRHRFLWIVDKTLAEQFVDVFWAFQGNLLGDLLCQGDELIALDHGAFARAFPRWNRLSFRHR